MGTTTTTTKLVTVSTTTSSILCDTKVVKAGKGDGYWDCPKTNKSVVICKYKCNRANIFTGAQAKCAKTGGKKGQWKYINFQKANCHPCTEDPNKTFPIPGNGEWKCKEGINTRCSIKCPNNDQPVNKGTISCHHIKSLN